MTILAIAVAAVVAACKPGRNIRPDTLIIEFRENDRYNNQWIVTAYELAGVAFVDRADRLVGYR